MSLQLKIRDITEAKLFEESLAATLVEIVKVMQPEFKQKLVVEKRSNLVDDLMRQHPLRGFDEAFRGCFLGTIYFVFRTAHKKFLGIPCGKLQRWITVGVDVGYPTENGMIDLAHLRQNGVCCVVALGRENLNNAAIENLTKWADEWSVKLTAYKDSKNQRSS